MEVGFELYIGFVLVALAFLAAFCAITAYNGLALQNNIGKAWANIDAVFKQRSDLIQNIMETVKGYKKYEKSALEEFTCLRSEIVTGTPAQRAKASELLTGALKSVFAVAEGCPELKANQIFLDLQKQLSAMEDQMADRREFYNDAVLLYNTRVKVLQDAGAIPCPK